MSTSPAILANIPLRIRITDINYGNHLGNDALVGLLHEARVDWLKRLSLSELNVGGPGIIMKDLHVNFKKECFWGDMLEVELTCTNLTTVSFELTYTVFRSNENQEALRECVATASTTLVCFNYERRKVSPVPEDLQKALRGNQ